ncbi:MAG: SDR family oxidoreductase [Chloroflexi bacterium]|nr:SDR family oxidoreductase [Chloroflexota bacterium]
MSSTQRWALILGASSGFGAATARALADAGFNIFGVHLDLKSTLPRARQVQADIEAKGRKAFFFNKNVADDRNRAEIIAKMKRLLGSRCKIHVVLHTVAFGNLKRYIADDPKDAVDRKAMEMTLDVMANSFVYWTQDLVRAGLLTRGSKVYSMTSAGSHRVFIGYGPVSAAKAALESHTRQLALELISKGICVNAIQAGAADTPALRAIPNQKEAVAHVKELHPDGRLTVPEDVARVIVALADPNVDWITGTVIRVDGGEDNW